MDASAYFKNKKITLMGLGLLGRGVGDAEYLARQGAELTVTDLKSAPDLAQSLSRLKQYENIRFVLGEHRLEDFQDADMVLKAAGVPLDSRYIAHAKQKNIPVRMSADLFAELAGIPLIAVTGTRGKSTVTQMIYDALKLAQKRALLGGNIRGISTLALLDEVRGDEVAVLEIDSWQASGFGEAKISPSISVFTTFMRDHMNYYGNDEDKYLLDKMQLFLYQKSSDTAVLGSQCAERIQKKFGALLSARVIVPGDLSADIVLKVPGEHNRYNASLASEALRAYGCTAEKIHSGLTSFGGVEGRLQFVSEVDGVKYYNDTNATTPEATIAALTALGDKNHLHLIFGGADKGLDMSALTELLPHSTKALYPLFGTGTQSISKQLPPNTEIYNSINAAFAQAKKNARAGDTILLSPAFASFGMFKNEYDRGDQFLALVKAGG